MTHPSVYYLDHAAATPVDRRVEAAMQPYFSDMFYNPSAPYAPAVEVRRAYQAAKQAIGQMIGGKGDDLVITAGATESIGLAFAAVDASAHVVTTEIEHHAVLANARRYDHTFAAVDARGRVDVETLAAALRPTTQLVSIALANNELGTIQPLRAVAALVKNERSRRLAAGDKTPIYFHTDASQGVGQLDVNVARLGVDLLTLNAGKIYGPKQVGALWLAPSVIATPLIVGGGQERGLRSGTENVPGVIGFAKAMELSVDHHKHEARRLGALRDQMQSELLGAFPHAVVSGHERHRLAGHLHISFPGIDAERVVFALEARGVLVATGSACAANSGTRSHVLTAIGLPNELADGSLRITLGRLSDEAGCAQATKLIIETIQAEQARMDKK